MPEVRPERPPLYSFNDLLFLRPLAYLRRQTSLQRISKAMEFFRRIEDGKHPGTFEYGTDGKSIIVRFPDGDAVNLVGNPGQTDLLTFDEIFATFTNFAGTHVPDFRNPANHIEVNQARLGGWPTAAGTRVGYDTIANLVDYDTIGPEDVAYYYPGVTPEAALGAIDLDKRVKEVVA